MQATIFCGKYWVIWSESANKGNFVTEFAYVNVDIRGCIANDNVTTYVFQLQGGGYGKKGANFGQLFVNDPQRNGKMTVHTVAMNQI